MKKFFLIFLCVCFSFVAIGCENEAALQVGHLSEVTSAMSTTYAINIVLDNDDRVNDKFVDLQIRCNKDEQVFNVYEEMGDKFTICLPQKNFWYNLTYLISKTNGAKDEASYVKCEDYGNHIYNFTTPNDVDVTFRLVAGQKKVNDQTQEEILVLSEEISKELNVKMKKYQEK